MSDNINNQTNAASVIQMIDYNLLKPDPDNKNIFNMDGIEALAISIKDDASAGIIEAFLDPTDGRYQIIVGHRRWMAHGLNKASKVPVIVRNDLSEKDRARKLILSNVNNRVLTPLDMTRAIEYYITHVLDPNELNRARKKVTEEFGISDATYNRCRNYAKLIPELQRFLQYPDFPYTALVRYTGIEEDVQYEIYMDISQYIADNGEVPPKKWVEYLIADRIGRNTKKKAPQENMQPEENIEVPSTSNDVDNNNDDNKTFFGSEISEGSFGNDDNGFGDDELPEFAGIDTAAILRGINSFAEPEKPEPTMNTAPEPASNNIDALVQLILKTFGEKEALPKKVQNKDSVRKSINKLRQLLDYVETML